MGYSYYKNEIADNSIVYSFTTDFKRIYTVYFDGAMYADFLEFYPKLLEKGYGFGFYYEAYAEEDKKKFDDRIYITIHEIILDFFESTGTDVILLFHCDHKDKRQSGRNKLFDKWHSSSTNNDIVKIGLEVEIKSEPVHHYIGFITKTQNPHIPIAIQELTSFSVDIVNENTK